MPDKKKSIDLASWLSFRQGLIREDTRGWGGFFAVLISLIGGLLLIASLVMLVRIVVIPAFSAEFRIIPSIGFLLAALIGAPFVIWRTWVADRQVRIEDESLFNDKINTAAKDLAARRQITRSVTQDDGTEVILTEWEDDIVTRCAAIDRLEGLAQERTPEAPRIARMLSVYVRELSKQDGLRPIDRPDGVTDITQIRNWAQSLKQRVRSDMEKAAQTLRTMIETTDIDPKLIDLRGANLQGFDLSGRNFSGADLGGARLEGAKLSLTNLQAAKLVGANLQGASLWDANLQCANLRGANLQRAVLGDANLQGADFEDVDLQGARLPNANLQGADLCGANIDEKTRFTDANLQFAAFESADLIIIKLSQEQLNSVFGDGSVTLPDRLTRPEHWPAEELSPSEFYERWHAWQRQQGYRPN